MNKSHLMITAAALFATSSLGFAQLQGTSSSAGSYMVPTSDGWSSTALLTVGDTAGNGYSMWGIPDGLGAYDNGNGTITLLMNHELSAGTLTEARVSGMNGAFVSQWTIDKNSLAVLTGQDLVQDSNNIHISGSINLSRLCSADLAAPSAFYSSSSSLGYDGRIFLNGEENGSSGRAMAWIATGSEAGSVYELPSMGTDSWENLLANPYTGNKTVVIGNDDSSSPGGQIYVYVGDKQSTGTAIEQAGLTNGTVKALSVSGVSTETTAISNGTSFTTANIGDSTITAFGRPEDGAWLDSNTYVFNTTGRGTSTARLYKIDFSDDTFSTGTISLIVDSASLTGLDGDGARYFDNLCVGADGMIYVQEDPGNNIYIAKTWQVDPSTGIATQIFQSDPAIFATAAAQDEENSGIIDVTGLFSDATWFEEGDKVLMGVTQAHNLMGDGYEFIEGGQLSLMVYSASAVPEPSSYATIFGALALCFVGYRRRRS